MTAHSVAKYFSERVVVGSLTVHCVIYIESVFERVEIFIFDYSRSALKINTANIKFIDHSSRPVIPVDYFP